MVRLELIETDHFSSPWRTNLDVYTESRSVCFYYRDGAR